MADFLNDLKGKAKSAYDAVSEGVSAGKKSFSKALVEAVDFTPASMRSQPWAQQQKAEREALVETAADIALPDQNDVLMPGIGKLGKAVKAIGKGAQMAEDAYKIHKAGSAAAKSAKTIPVIESTVRGFEHLNKPGLKTVEEKAVDAAKGFGKVIIEEVKKPKIGKVTGKVY